MNTKFLSFFWIESGIVNIINFFSVLASGFWVLVESPRAAKLFHFAGAKDGVVLTKLFAC